MIVLAISFFVMYGSIFLSTRQCDDNSGPFLLVTSHNYHNVYKFTLDGCLVKGSVLWGGQATYRGGLRSVKIGTYMGEEALYVADSGKTHAGNYNYWSKVMVFGPSNWGTGFREYKTTVYDASEDLTGSHPYAITFDGDGNVYVSFQHSDNVLRFVKDSFERMPLPAALTASANSNNTAIDYPAGSFFQFGKPGIHASSEQGIRSVQWVDNHLWVANENKREAKYGITILDRDGYIVGHVDIRKPIYIYYDALKSPHVWIGTKESSSGRFEGAVVAINKDTLKVVHIFQSERLVHPTGIVLHEDRLYVGDQTTNTIQVFDRATTAPLPDLDIKKYLSGAIEIIEISST
jgi:hypothetical protein